MISLQVFDPAMCCSTGVCGPSVEPKLAHFSADLDWLKSQGVSVERFNLAQQPAAFVADAAVKLSLDEQGEAALPVIKLNGEVKSRGLYPSRAELAVWAGLPVPAQSLFTEAAAALVSLSAAVALHSEANIKLHLGEARRLGVSTEDINRVVAAAQSIKDSASKTTAAFTARLLRPAGGLRVISAEPGDDSEKQGCC